MTRRVEVYWQGECKGTDRGERISTDRGERKGTDMENRRLLTVVIGSLLTGRAEVY